MYSVSCAKLWTAFSPVLPVPSPLFSPLPCGYCIRINGWLLPSSTLLTCLLTYLLVLGLPRLGYPSMEGYLSVSNCAWSEQILIKLKWISVQRAWQRCSVCGGGTRIPRQKKTDENIYIFTRSGPWTHYIPANVASTSMVSRMGEGRGGGCTSC